SFSRKSLLEDIGYTKNQKNYDMIDEILDTLQEKGLLEIHTECKTVNNNVKSMFFVLDNAYEEPQEKQEQSNKVAAKADHLLVGQDDTPEKKENDKISAPQNKQADSIKPPEVYDSWTDAYCKMMKKQEEKEKLKKQEEENKRKEELRQIREMNAELEKNPAWQELMNWDYK